jgi:short-subunit dehydrogenase
MSNLSGRAQRRLDELSNAIESVNQVAYDNDLNDSTKTIYLLSEIAKQLANVNYNLEIIDEDLEKVEDAVSGS